MLNFLMTMKGLCQATVFEWQRDGIICSGKVLGGNVLGHFILLFL